MINSLINNYLLRPESIWSPELVKKLSERMSNELIVSGVIREIRDYTTASLFINGPTTVIEKYSEIDGINLEKPEYTILKSFYSESGLELMPVEDFEVYNVKSQLQKAFVLLKIDLSCAESISYLVKAIQILRQPEPEYDVSYSHPKIPFTIFVSIGIHENEVDIIRLAESILHEAMHLKLSLIEREVSLINDKSQHYFSPWRDAYRPLGGVLHGLYVFKSIKKWYNTLLGHLTDHSSKDFISWRVETIDKEIDMLSDFHLCTGLTKTGSHFAKALTG